MQLVVTLFVAVHVLAVTVYVALAAYVASNRSPRSADLPFIAFCLSQVFDASTYLLLNTPNAPAGIPDALRLRAAMVLLSPAFILHVTVGLLRGRQRRVGLALTLAAYIVGGTGALLAGFTDWIMAGVASSGLPGAYILRPILGSAGYAFASFSTAINLTFTLPLLFYAIVRGTSARLRSDAHHILAPALLLTLSILTRLAAIGLPPALLPTLSLALGIVQRGLSLGAGLLLANNVLRFGSPAGQPVHHCLAPITIVLTAAVLVDIVPLLHPGHTADLSYLTPPLLTGLLAGVLLARPESLRLSDRWLGRLPPPETAFAHALRPAWRALAVQDLERLCLEDLKRALQRDIAAAYVEVLKRTVDTGESNALVFAGDAGNPMVRLPSDDLKWPIAESTAGKRGIQTQALPGPASLILPILMDGDVIGILTMGEPERGGVYGRSEIMRAEMLADLLSAASSAGVPLVEDAGTRSARRHPAKATPVPPAIRAFGRLEVIPARSPLAGTPTIPLRARQLLAFLLTAHPEAVPGETLMERLWPEAPPNMAGNCLYVAVHALRRALEPGLASGMLSRYVLHEAGGYRLQLDTSIWVDTREFEDSYRRGQRLARANHAEAAAREFQKALAHYRGAFLAEVALNQSPEIEAVRQRLRRQCGDMARFVVQQLVEQGGSEEAEELLLSLRRADPRDETFIDLLARIGRRVAPSTPAPGPGDHTGGTAAGPKAASSPPSGMKPGYADP